MDLEEVDSLAVLAGVLTAIAATEIKVIPFDSEISRVDGCHQHPIIFGIRKAPRIVAVRAHLK